MEQLTGEEQRTEVLALDNKPLSSTSPALPASTALTGAAQRGSHSALFLLGAGVGWCVRQFLYPSAQNSRTWLQARLNNPYY